MAFFTSCNDENNDILRDPDPTTDPVAETYNLIVNPTNANQVKERNLIITADANAQVPVKVNFKGSESMYRLYITKNVIGSTEGPVPFEYSGAVLKSDGSINLDAEDKAEFTYNLSFDAPAEVGQTVQYVLWATTGRGDFRDVTKRNAITGNAFGVITIKAGSAPTTGTVDAALKSFSAVILAAPLSDGSSETFISLFNNQKYAINQGVEYAALWDFGYFYGATKNASFASAYDYPSDVVDVVSISGVSSKDELNHFYVTKSTKTATDFDNISTGSDLDAITKPTTERVTGLSTGNVIEFVDAYGNKGLIKVTEIKGTYNSGDYIKFDVKVQVKAEPIKG